MEPWAIVELLVVVDVSWYFSGYDTICGERSSTGIINWQDWNRSWRDGCMLPCQLSPAGSSLSSSCLEAAILPNHSNKHDKVLDNSQVTFQRFGIPYQDTAKKER